MRDISLYIHIPFCIKKCLYCDFNSFSDKNGYFEKYKNSLLSEINNFEKAQGLKVNTIFIGGGTPSLLPSSFIYEILDALGEKFYIEKNAEISIEANPGTADFNKFSEYRKSGVNRLSIGVQAVQDKILKILGRVYDKAQFLKSVEFAKRAGFENINFDLMFAIPGQSFYDWEETLKTAVYLNPSHLSVYSLIIEEGTPFYDMMKKGELSVVSDENDRKMYYMAKDILKQSGYIQYEISNFAKKGAECRHNIVYWKRKEYIGFGLGACSFFEGKRFHNNVDIDEYINGRVFGENEDFSEDDAFAEFMFLGLRMNRGISEKEFYDYFNVHLYDIFGDEIERNIKRGLIEKKDGRICLSEKGFDLSNIVFTEFLRG